MKKILDSSLRGPVMLVDTNVMIRRNPANLVFKVRTNTGCNIGICDFIYHELCSLDGRFAKCFTKRIKRLDGVLFLRTEFKTKEESKRALDTLPRESKAAVLKVYRSRGELQSGSRFRDFALISETFRLADNGIECGVLTFDKTLEEAVRGLSRYNSNIRVHSVRDYLFPSERDNTPQLLAVKSTAPPFVGPRIRKMSFLSRKG